MATSERVDAAAREAARKMAVDALPLARRAVDRYCDSYVEASECERDRLAGNLAESMAAYAARVAEEEREACAEIAEEYGEDRVDEHAQLASEDIAAAIRARGVNEDDVPCTVEGKAIDE